MFLDQMEMKMVLIVKHYSYFYEVIPIGERKIMWMRLTIFIVFCRSAGSLGSLRGPSGQILSNKLLRLILKGGAFISVSVTHLETVAGTRNNMRSGRGVDSYIYPSKHF